MDAPRHGDWDQDEAALPPALRRVRMRWRAWKPTEHASLRRAYYALITHIDHQIRVLLGTLREEGLIDDTIVLFTADHGDMLGDFGLWAKRLLYEGSAGVPMILIGRRGDEETTAGREDARLVGLQDVMPTLLGMAGLPVPDLVEGLCMFGDRRRPYLYGEFGEDVEATRMLHDGRHKLIWYPAGNRVQLFDLHDDPDESIDRANDPACAAIRDALAEALVEETYGIDEDGIAAGRLKGTDAASPSKPSNRGFSGQRGLHFPPPPPGAPAPVVGPLIRR